MDQLAVNARHGAGRKSVFTPQREMSLLGDTGPAESRSRVLNANNQSRFTTPADLDAFLGLGIQRV